MVSHDNFFMNRVAEHLFVFQGDGVVRDFQGSYTDYLEYRRDERTEAKLSSKSIASAANRALDGPQVVDEGNREAKNDSSTGIGHRLAPVEGTSIPPALSFNERKEFKKLEKDVLKIGIQIDQLEGQIATGSSRGEGYSVLSDWTLQLQKLKAQLEEKELRWLELAEK